jgi:hypothetical protein
MRASDDGDLDARTQDAAGLPAGQAFGAGARCVHGELHGAARARLLARRGRDVWRDFYMRIFSRLPLTDNY